MAGFANDADGVRYRHAAPGAFFDDDQPTPYQSGQFHDDHEEWSNGPHAAPSPPPNPNPRVYGPRTCRICFEVNHPTMIPSTIPSIPGIAPRPPKVVYESEEPELGRLISPCKCKGGSRYVHEGCLQQWRMQAPARERNYWKCPTCGYRYRLERLHYASMIQSFPSQVALTILVFTVAMFVMGFIADPIINMYLDPWATLGSFVGYRDYFGAPSSFDLYDEEPLSWVEHFLKGVVGLGVVGCLRAVLTSPLSWYRLRISTNGGHGGRTTGRDRINDISWVVIIVGVLTTLYGIYKGVAAFSRRALMATAERVLDIGGDEGEEAEDGN